MNAHATRIMVALLVVGTMGALLLAQGDSSPQSGKAMMQAAQSFQKALSKEQLDKGSFKFDDVERLNWHFIPRQRKGLPLRDLEGSALKAAQALVASGLSSTGYEQALNIMSLEELLYLLESGDRVERRERRNPCKYYLSIF